MKIVYIYDSIYPYAIGGVEKRIWDISILLQGKGHEIHLFGPKYWKGEYLLKKEGIILHGVCKPTTKRVSNGRRSITWPIVFSLSLLPHLIKNKFDIIDCQNFPYFPCFAAKFATLFTGSKLIITWHEVWDAYWFEYLGTFRGGIGKFIESLCLMLTKNVIALTMPVKAKLLEHGLKSKYINLLQPSINLEYINSVAPSADISDLIFIGRLVSYRNIDIAVKAVLKIKDRYPGIKFIIIGIGPERDKLINLVVSLNLKANICFRDNLPYNELIACLKSSKIFLLPSFLEGIPQIILEANACGIPVITTNHKMNDAKYCIDNGQNGLIISLSVDQLSDSIISILGDEELFNYMSKRSCEQANKYDYQKTISNLEKTYCSILKNKYA